MKKLLLLFILLISTNSFANCAATARANTGAVRFGDFQFDGVYAVSINNPTDVQQTYEICREVHSQYYNHTSHFQASDCYHVHIKAHEGLSQDSKLTLHTNYNRLEEHPKGVWLDTIIRIRGECNVDANEHIVVPMQE